MQLPYARVDIGSDGALATASQRAAALRLVTDTDPTAVVIFVHGWNNSAVSAENLYERLVNRLADRAGPQDRFVVLGVVWPSLEWAEEPRAGGGALADIDPQKALVARIDDVVEDRDVAARLRAAASALDTDPAARSQFVTVVRDHLLPAAETVEDDDSLPSTLTDGDTDEFFQSLQDALVGAIALAPPALDDEGAAAGFSLGGLNPFTIARTMVNTASYYKMKERAGLVGTNGVALLLHDIAQQTAKPATLVGHSFGARAVTAAVAAGAPAHALCLLQGAFSHVAFTKNSPTGQPGAFRAVIDGGNFTGPVIDTYTHNDRAVLIAYAIASRIARQVAASLGDRDDPYGGIGANGAVGLDAAEVDDSVPLQPANGDYAFDDHRVHNLRADTYVENHSDIDGAEVANAVYQAIRND